MTLGDLKKPKKQGLECPRVSNENGIEKRTSLLAELSRAQTADKTEVENAILAGINQILSNQNMEIELLKEQNKILKDKL